MIKVLPFVLMQSFYLSIKNRFRADLKPGRDSIASQNLFVVHFDITEIFRKNHLGKFR